MNTQTQPALGVHIDEGEERTFAAMFWLVHNGSYRRARSEPRAPVRGGGAAAAADDDADDDDDADVVAAASRLLHATCPQMFLPHIGMRQERGRGVWGCV